MNLRDFAAALGPDPILDALSDWAGILHYLAGAAKGRPGLTVILDEFPYLTDGDPALPSVIQKFWNSDAPDAGRLNLVLCGSAISRMEDLPAEKNPLYGRKTMAMEVEPLPLRDAARFFPSYAPDEQIAAYAVFGGIPYYLRLCDPDAGLECNVVELLLTPSAPLIDEPMFLLQSEVRGVQRYASIVAAIADGGTKLGDTAGRVREVSDVRGLGPYLEGLIRMRVVRSVRSLDATERERDRRYVVADPLFAFWHRFVRPNISTVVRGFGAEVWRHQIAPHFAGHMGLGFEEICREHARQHAQERLPAPAQEVGQIWAGDFDIDVAGRLLDGTALFGECKWWSGPVGEGVLDGLAARAARSGYEAKAPRRAFALYSKSGFSDAVLARAEGDPLLALHTPASILGTEAAGRVRRPGKPGRRTARRGGGA